MKSCVCPLGKRAHVVRVPDFVKERLSHGTPVQYNEMRWRRMFATSSLRSAAVAAGVVVGVTGHGQSPRSPPRVVVVVHRTRRRPSIADSCSSVARAPDSTRATIASVDLEPSTRHARCASGESGTPVRAGQRHREVPRRQSTAVASRAALVGRSSASRVRTTIIREFRRSSTSIPADDAEAVARALGGSGPTWSTRSPSYRVHTEMVPNDTFYTHTSGICRSSTWSARGTFSRRPARAMTVAVLDTGIAYTRRDVRFSEQLRRRRGRQRRGRRPGHRVIRRSAI